jgi:predicted DNA-binding transcriptional regulator AlpA
MTGYLNTDEFAALAHTTPATIRYWVHTGYAPQSAKIGRRRIWKEAAVRAWLDSKFETDDSASAT